MTMDCVKTQTQKGKRHVKMEAEPGVIHLQTNEPQGLPEAGRDKEGSPISTPQSFCKKPDPACTLILDLWPPEL